MCCGSSENKMLISLDLSRNLSSSKKLNLFPAKAIFIKKNQCEDGFSFFKLIKRLFASITSTLLTMEAILGQILKFRGPALWIFNGKVDTIFPDNFMLWSNFNRAAFWRQEVSGAIECNKMWILWRVGEREKKQANKEENCGGKNENFIRRCSQGTSFC